MGHVDRVTSPEFKKAGSRVVLIEPAYKKDSAMPEAEGFLDAVDVVEGLIDEGNALAVSTPGFGGLAEALFKMCVGNGIGL